MPRAIRVVAAAERGDRPVADTLILDYVQRGAQTLSLAGVKGGPYAIDLPAPARLRTDDLLELDDGRLLEVVAAAESLLEARAADLTELTRLAWQLGDRHVPVQILTNRLRVRREPALETLLAALGAKTTAIEAPFEPEGGAYASAHADGHGHHDHHHHDH
jgi:urease accessory protein